MMHHCIVCHPFPDNTFLCQNERAEICLFLRHGVEYIAISILEIIEKVEQFILIMSIIHCLAISVFLPILCQLPFRNLICGAKLQYVSKCTIKSAHFCKRVIIFTFILNWLLPSVDYIRITIASSRCIEFAVPIVKQDILGVLLVYERISPVPSKCTVKSLQNESHYFHILLSSSLSYILETKICSFFYTHLKTFAYVIRRTCLIVRWKDNCHENRIKYKETECLQNCLTLRLFSNPIPLIWIHFLWGTSICW